MQSTQEIQELCKLVRHYILTSTTHAGSGHPTSSLSAVELVTTLFFGGYFKQDVAQPHNLHNDKFILSKGHASPLLYSLYRVAGALTDSDLEKLREANSRLEGHPTPLFPYDDVETGSLGQGLSVGLGMALGINLKTKKLELKTENKPKVFVLLGDSEVAEGQIWEAAEVASYYKTNNLVAILDVNRLGQRGETMIGWNLQTYANRFKAFGWNVFIIEDGHNIAEIQKAFQQSLPDDQPTIFIAKTIKGKGISFLENKENWHGKPVPKERLNEALVELGELNLNLSGNIISPTVPTSDIPQTPIATSEKVALAKHYALHDKIATRQAYGDALVELGHLDESVVVLDAEVSNSTFAESFKKTFPERYFEMFIAEQNMVSVALGLSKIGFKPYVSSFASFLTRAFDQIRMSQYSYTNITFCGSHVGVSIGEDGSSQMGLEDISMFRSILNSTIFYPSDANSALQQLKLLHNQKGINYLRTTRAALPVLYSLEESKNMKIGGSKILRQSPDDKVVVLSAGITLHEVLKVHDALKNEGISIAVVDLYSIKPIDIETIKRFSHLPIVVVEDHYLAGGIAEAILSELSQYKIQISNFTNLCVKQIPHSGSPEENLHYQEIDASAIMKRVKDLVA